MNKQMCPRSLVLLRQDGRPVSAAQLLDRLQYSSCATRARRNNDFVATAGCLSLQAWCLCISAGLPKLLIAWQEFFELCHEFVASKNNSLSV